METRYVGYVKDIALIQGEK